MDRHILITGGTGKTGRWIAAKLRQRGLEPRITSRAAEHAGQVRFDP